MIVKYRIPLERGAVEISGATDSYGNRQSKAMVDSYIDTQTDRQTDMCRNSASRHKQRTRQVER